MSNPSFAEIVATTMVHQRKVLNDTISKNNVLIFTLRRFGGVETFPGGRTLVETIMMGDENVNFSYYTGDDALNGLRQEVLTAAEYPLKQWACGVSMTGLEQLQNSGEDAKIDMMMARTKHAQKTITNQMHKAAHGNGTDFGGKAMAGLGHLVSTTAGATVGGINSGLYTWWDNIRLAVGGVAPDVNAIYGDMLDMLMATTRGTDKPNLIVSDNIWFSTFSQALQGQQRFANQTLANAGFDNITFHSVPVVFDGGQGGYAPAGMKFLNTSTIKMMTHKDRNNTVLAGPRRPVLEDTDTVIIAGCGNFTCGNRKLNGALTL